MWANSIERRVWFGEGLHWGRHGHAVGERSGHRRWRRDVGRRDARLGLRGRWKLRRRRHPRALIYAAVVVRPAAWLTLVAIAAGVACHARTDVPSDAGPAVVASSVTDGGEEAAAAAQRPPGHARAAGPPRRSRPTSRPPPPRRTRAWATIRATPCGPARRRRPSHARDRCCSGPTRAQGPCRSSRASCCTAIWRGCRPSSITASTGPRGPCGIRAQRPRAPRSPRRRPSITRSPGGVGRAPRSA